MERRIYGLENEYGVTCTLRGQRRLSPDEVAPLPVRFHRVLDTGDRHMTTEVAKTEAVVAVAPAGLSADYAIPRVLSHDVAPAVVGTGLHVADAYGTAET